jgi:hypothetical protein
MHTHPTQRYAALLAEARQRACDHLLAATHTASALLQSQGHDPLPPNPTPPCTDDHLAHLRATLATAIGLLAQPLVRYGTPQPEAIAAVVHLLGLQGPLAHSLTEAVGFDWALQPPALTPPIFLS